MQNEVSVNEAKVMRMEDSERNKTHRELRQQLNRQWTG
jgi:hypothetical protein